MNIYQYVSINGTNSDYMNVLCGVPQGSILGPILFIRYINDMCYVSTFLKPILFADDTNLFYSGKDIDNNNNGRNGSCLTWLATSLEEKRRWLVINASPRGQCSK